MVQAHAGQVLNQKETSGSHSPLADPRSVVSSSAQRLFNALGRLENSLAHVTVGRDRDVQRDQQLVTFERENDWLRREHDRLSDALAQLEKQYKELHKLASTIHGRLDESIHHLTQILEE